MVCVGGTLRGGDTLPTKTTIEPDAPTESKAPPENKPERKKASKKVSIRELLKPHLGSLSLGLLGVIGEGVANLLEPWPLKSSPGRCFARA